MEIIENLNIKIDKLLHDYERLKQENEFLKKELNSLQSENEELSKNNQDMFLRIDNSLNLIKVQKGE